MGTKLYPRTCGLAALPPLRGTRGRPTAHGNRCPEHAIPALPRSGTYTRTARRIVDEATYCWLCGGGPRPDDPFVADHVLPRAYGGADSIDNLRPAHRSCN